MTTHKTIQDIQTKIDILSFDKLLIEEEINMLQNQLDIIIQLGKVDERMVLIPDMKFLE